jgi:DNA segregation ATPase FtsK/SpoIIIE-like protein
MFPVAWKMNEAINAIRAVVREVDRRQDLFASTGVLDLVGYNKKNAGAPLPRIAVFVDELQMFWLSGGRRSSFYVDLIDVAGRARGSGVHLFVATTTPQSEVMDSMLKNNLETKISGHQGRGGSMATFGNGVAAELPMVPGRMVARLPGKRGLTYFQVPFVDEDQLSLIAAHVAGQGGERPIVIDAKRTDLSLSPDEQIVFDVAMKLNGNVTVGRLWGTLNGKVAWHTLNTILVDWRAKGLIEARMNGRKVVGRRLSIKMFERLGIEAPSFVYE